MSSACKDVLDSRPFVTIGRAAGIAYKTPTTPLTVIHPSHCPIIAPPVFLISNPTTPNNVHATTALTAAPTPTSPIALAYPQSSRISKAATLLIITAQLTALAEEGKS